MVASVDTIQLTRLNFSDTTHRITTGTDRDKLVSSIGRLGVLVPPLVKPQGQGFIIISGFQRLNACRQLGIAATAVRLAAPDASALDCAHWAIAENGLQRPLNPLETARAMALLAAAVPQKNMVAQEAAAAGLPSNSGMIAKLLRVVQLPAALQTCLADGTIGLAMALALGDLEPDFALSCVEIFSTLEVGLNRQREILSLITEISARDGIPPVRSTR